MHRPLGVGLPFQFQQQFLLREGEGVLGPVKFRRCRCRGQYPPSSTPFPTPSGHRSRNTNSLQLRFPPQVLAEPRIGGSSEFRSFLARAGHRTHLPSTSRSHCPGQRRCAPRCPHRHIHRRRLPIQLIYQKGEETLPMDS